MFLFFSYSFFHIFLLKNILNNKNVFFLNNKKKNKSFEGLWLLFCLLFI
jgi:hypothetical protein